MTTSHRSRESPPRQPVLLLIVLLLLLGVAAFFLLGRKGDRKAIDTAEVPPAATGMHAGSVGEPERPELPAVPAEQSPATALPPQPPPSPPQDLPDAPGTTPEKRDRCLEAGKAIAAMYDYLDGQPYIREYRLPSGIAGELPALFGRLLATPPEVSLAGGDPLATARAMVHLFRVLGPTDIGLLQSLLAKETGRLEFDLDNLYAWHLQPPPCPDPTLTVSPRQAYEYAAFFLATPAGNAYLARRDGRLNLLARYYCLRIVDLANDLAINRYGIDIMKYATPLRKEIEQSATLQFQAEYLRILDGFATKYPQPATAMP